MRPEELLKKGLSDLGFPSSEEQIQAFMIYLAELKKWNRAYNLTALTTDEDIVTKHFLDSVLCYNSKKGLLCWKRE
jgi:16S rRNA (guanine527-N7)-methyltransferase